MGDGYQIINLFFFIDHKKQNKKKQNKAQKEKRKRLKNKRK